MRNVDLFICSSCGAAFYPPVAEARGNKCLSCNGSGKVKPCAVDESGVVHVVVHVTAD